MSHFTTFIATEDPANIDWLMEPFCESTEDMDYLEFIDHDEEVRREYNESKVDCIKLPHGMIVPYYYRAARDFEIKDGKVFQRKAGPLHHAMRTKKAKKLHALPEYPIRKLYASLEDYAENYHSYAFSEEHQAYGYYTNPNAFWDWYVIGGRWPFRFLVKVDCDSAVYSEDRWDKEKASVLAPKGYQWVAGARKRDIEWDVMRAHRIEKRTKRLAELEQWYRSGVRPADDDLFASITEEGIISWQQHMLYVKDETLEQYLERNDLGPDCKYPVYAFSYVDENGYSSHGDMGWWGISSNDKPDEVWRSMLQEFLERVPEENFIVSLDCHI